MEVDRLGALPEALLLDIINRLDWKEAARTAVLSKQWRFLWTELPFPFICMSKNIEEIRRFAAGVHAALALRRGRALETLSVDFYYDQRLASDVDSWLDYAAKMKVKDVSFNLHTDTDYENFSLDRYDLPPAIYSNSSMVQLYLEKCAIASVTTPVEWRCLKCLWLKNVDFRRQQAIGEILSGCPLLETLTLYICRGFSCLEIGSRSFRYLSVTYYMGLDSLEIWAPYMKHLHIHEIMSSTSDETTTVRFENVGSLESAGFDISPAHSSSLEAICTAMEKFFHLGRSLKELSLDYGFSEALSTTATHGWRFAHLMKVEVLSLSGAKPCGVVVMLESCPLVREVFLHSHVPEEEESVKCGPITRDDLNRDLMHLKTVKFEEYFEPGNSGEPLVTMAKILLRRAPNLEKMVIYKTDDDPVSMKELDDLKNTLLQFPRSSHKAIIEIQ